MDQDVACERSLVSSWVYRPKGEWVPDQVDDSISASRRARPYRSPLPVHDYSVTIMQIHSSQCYDYSTTLTTFSTEGFGGNGWKLGWSRGIDVWTAVDQSSISISFGEA
jgi:hypothetical protein